ncbi:MAG: RNA-guided endonuclease InsQ/TnpB family protein [Xenococcaceae cyanobacterium]
MFKVVKVRLYPNPKQQQQLTCTFGAARWWWNYALNKSIEAYKDTGKGLGQTTLNALLPPLKKAEETSWLGDCYSQVLQAATLNLTTAYKNFFALRAGFPRFKSRRDKQSIQYPQNVKVGNNFIILPKMNEAIKAKVHRTIEGEVKTVTVSLNPSGKYFASILFEVEDNLKNKNKPDGIVGVDLGIKHFAITFDGKKVSKYENPKHFAKHERNLKRKQQKLSKKEKGSNSRYKYRIKVAKIHERVSNARTDFLHKLSTKLVRENQTVIVENLHVRGMVRNHKLAKSISDCGWGIFVNFLSYKLERSEGKLIEIDRWFPSSKLCSSCFYQMDKMPLEIREWTCPSCGTNHDRDGNASANIRAEGIRMLQADGTAVSVAGGDVRPKLGRKTRLGQSSMNAEAKGLCGEFTSIL